MTKVIVDKEELQTILNQSDIPCIEIYQLLRCKDCKFNYNNIEKDPLCATYDKYDNMTDIVCTYWESDGLTPNDYCSQGKEILGEEK